MSIQVVPICDGSSTMIELFHDDNGIDAGKASRRRAKSNSISAGNAAADADATTFGITHHGVRKMIMKPVGIIGIHGIGCRFSPPAMVRMRE